MSATQPETMGNHCDATFREIVTAGWANRSDGDVESPTGAFALVTITLAELPELMEAVGIDWHLDAAKQDLVGSFNVIENEQGQVWVLRYDSAKSATLAYEARVQSFERWHAQGEED